MNDNSKDPMKTSELLKQLTKPPESETITRNNTVLTQLLLRGSAGTSTHPDLKRPSSLDEGPAKKHVPSLDAMLDTQIDRTIPPPIPRYKSSSITIVEMFP